MRKRVLAFVAGGGSKAEASRRFAVTPRSLLPELSPGMTVILDNAAFHKSKTTEQLIRSAGCELLFLPPYSPDLNPIETT